MQRLSEADLAKMPSCNLAKTVHNKWLQQSGNCGNDLYIATVDDLVRAFMQMVRYYEFFKGDHACKAEKLSQTQVPIPL